MKKITHGKEAYLKPETKKYAPLKIVKGQAAAPSAPLPNALSTIPVFTYY